MRLATFIPRRRAGTPRLGAFSGAHMLDLPGVYAAYLHATPDDESATPPERSQLPASALEFLRAGEVAREAATRALAFAAGEGVLDALLRTGLAYPLGDVTLLPPVPNPGKILCVGHNYRTHVAEMGRELPQYPTLFAKFANTLIGAGQPIPLPRVSKAVDYEAELAVVIGRSGKDIPRERAMEYVAGYTIFNDVSVRDFQQRTLQWFQGKNFDGSGPLGPALVTLDEIAHPQALDLTLRLNGERMQQANTSDFIFDAPTLVSYISEILTLEPGDIIATGTPGGVGTARDPQVYLKAGDTVEVEIAELGRLTNPVGAA